VSRLRPQPIGIPAPSPSARSTPYWEGCRRGELRHQRCPACDAIPAKATSLCPRCQHRELTWERSSGQGSLYSWTVVWRPQHPSFEVPYAPAIIELDEGFHLLSAMVGCDSGDLRVGLRVEVEFHPISDVITLPYFRPSST